MMIIDIPRARNYTIEHDQLLLLFCVMYIYEMREEKWNDSMENSKQLIEGAWVPSKMFYIKKKNYYHIYTHDRTGSQEKSNT